MSDHELEILKLRLDARVKMTQTLIAGMKDLFVVLASVATLYIQTANSGKIDLAAQTAASTNAVTLKWRAEHTGDPIDAAKAEKAEARLETVTDKGP
jgi:hypothetical protein